MRGTIVAAPTSRTYEPALDGIRGLAVAAVLLFHGGYLTGGYLGVDAFFVLSGFLITALLLDELTRSGTVSLTTFWARRARRLLPALLMVLVAVAVYAALVTDGTERAGIGWDAVATLGYVANWREILVTDDYWALFEAPSPLQHAWSLAIEEQFYLVWPIAVLLLTRHAAPRVVARRVTIASALLATASIGSMQLLYDSHVTARVYYGTDTRAASILIGGALAGSLFGRPRAIARTGRRAVLEIAGLASAAALAVAWITLDGESPVLYRGGLVACAVATAIVIAAVTHPVRGPLHRLLAAGPLCRLGVISYGVYLWHWPIYVVLDEARTGVRGVWLLALRVAVTFVVAGASFVAVERPARSWRPGDRGVLVATVPATVTVLVVIAIATLPWTTVTAPAASEAAANPGASGRLRVLVAGDSQAVTLSRIDRAPFAALGIDQTYRAVLGCGIALGDRRMGDRWRSPRAECASVLDRFRDGVEQLDPEVVVLYFGVWELFDRRLADGKVLSVGSRALEDHLAERLDDAHQVLTAHGARLALLSVPCYRPELQTIEMNPVLADSARIGWVNAVLRRWVARHPDDTVILDYAAFLCPGGQYVERLSGHVVRYDGVHLSPEGAVEVWRWLAPQLHQLVHREGTV